MTNPEPSSGPVKLELLTDGVAGYCDPETGVCLVPETDPSGAARPDADEPPAH